jgi:hypothetical protein
MGGEFSFLPTEVSLTQVTSKAELDPLNFEMVQ